MFSRRASRPNSSQTNPWASFARSEWQLAFVTGTAPDAGDGTYKVITVQAYPIMSGARTRGVYMLLEKVGESDSTYKLEREYGTDFVQDITDGLLKLPGTLVEITEGYLIASSIGIPPLPPPPGADKRYR